MRLNNVGGSRLGALLLERGWLLPMLGLLVLLLFRNSFLFGPNIFGDELSYSVLSRASGKAAAIDVGLVAPLPNHLFFDVYGLAAAFGTAASGVARALNALFCALTVLPLYVLTRRWLQPIDAALAGVATALVSAGLYSGMFMPESQYAFLFFCCFAVAVECDDHRWTSLPTLGLLSALLAALILTKPHGFVVACVLCLMPVMSWRWGHWGANALLTLKGAGVLFGAVILRQVYVQVSGDVGALNPGGSLGLYQNILSSIPKFLGSPLMARALAEASWQNSAAALPFVVPAGIAIFATRAPIEQDRKQLIRAGLAGLATLVALMAMTIVFTALVGVTANESGSRVHQRYYDHGLALLVALGLCGWCLPARLPRGLVIAASVLAAGTVAAFLLRYPLTSVSYIDHPLLHGAFHTPLIGKWALLLPLLVPLAGLLGPRWRRIGFFLLLALLCYWISLAMLVQSRESRRMMGADRLGLALTMLAEAGEEKPLVLASAGNDRPHRVAFFTGAGAQYRILDPRDTGVLRALLNHTRAKSIYADNALQLGPDWIMVQAMPGEFSEYVRRADFERLTERYVSRETVDFSRPGNQVFAGFHGFEPWGAWMSSTTASVTLKRPMQGRYAVIVEGRKLDQSHPASARMQLCDQGFQLPMRDTTSPVRVEVECKEASSAIILAIPSTTSPLALGLNQDDRELGLALQSIRIERIEATEATP